MSEFQEIAMPAPTAGYMHGDAGAIVLISTGKDSVFFAPDALPQLIVELDRLDSVFNSLQGRLGNAAAVRQAMAEAGL